MFSRYRTRGFLLKKIDQGEADQILTFYTQDFGKLNISARSVRKVKSKLRTGVAPFLISEIEFVQGKTLKTLTDSIVVLKFGKIGQDLKKIEIYRGMLRLLDCFIKGQEKDEKIWPLILHSFENLEKEDFNGNSKPEIFYLHFFWNLVSLLGYGIGLHDCVFCQKKLSLGKLGFSSLEGGIICPSCLDKEAKALTVSPETIKILRVFLEKDWDFSSKIKAESRQFDILKEISQQHFSAIKENFNLVR